MRVLVLSIFLTIAGCSSTPDPGGAELRGPLSDRGNESVAESLGSIPETETSGAKAEVFPPTPGTLFSD